MAEKWIARAVGPVLLVLAASFAGVSKANLLVDGGFESPLTFDGPPYVGSWEGFYSAVGFADAAIDIAMPYTGAQALQLTSSDDNHFAGVFQDVVVTTGTVLDLTGVHLSTLDSYGVEIRFEYRDSVADVFISGTTNYSPTPGNAYEAFAISDALSPLQRTVPVGADLVRVIYAIQSFGSATDQNVLVDELDLFDAGDRTEMPEPAIVMLLIVGVIAAVARQPVRRRTG